MEPNISSKIIKNTKYNTIGYLWGILVNLFLTPYIIHRIGIERFGVWAIVGVVTGYFGLLDLGIGTSYVKYISEFYAKKEYDKINQVVNSGIFFHSILAVVVVISSFFFVRPLLNVLKIPPHLFHEAVIVFLIGIFIFFASNVCSVFFAIQTGLQRMDISNKLAIALSVVNAIGTVYFIKNGYGLIGLMINNFIVFVISGIVSIIVAFKILPELKVTFDLIRKHVIVKILNFGYRVQIARVSGAVTNQAEKLLIVYFLSTGFVTLFQLGNSIVSYAMSLVFLAVSALMPALSEIEAKGQRDLLLDAYIRTTKYLAFIVMPLYVFLIISASSIMLIWMGKGYEMSVPIIQILALGWMLNAVAQVAGSVSIAIDRAQLMAKASLIIISVNIALSVFFIKMFGFLGAAWGTAIAVNIGTVYFLVTVNKALNVSLRRFIYTILPCLLVSICASVVIYGLDRAINSFNLTLDRYSALGIFFFRGLVFLAVYILIAGYFKFFDKYDINLLRQRLPFIHNLLVRFPAYAK